MSSSHFKSKRKTPAQIRPYHLPPKVQSFRFVRYLFPMSKVRAELSEILRGIERHDHHVVLTSHGKPKAVIVPIYVMELLDEMVRIEHHGPRDPVTGEFEGCIAWGQGRRAPHWGWLDNWERGERRWRF